MSNVASIAERAILTQTCCTAQIEPGLRRGFQATRVHAQKDATNRTNSKFFALRRQWQSGTAIAGGGAYSFTAPVIAET